MHFTQVLWLLFVSATIPLQSLYWRAITESYVMQRWVIMTVQIQTKSHPPTHHLCTPCINTMDVARVSVGMFYNSRGHKHELTLQLVDKLKTLLKILYNTICI